MKILVDTPVPYFVTKDINGNSISTKALQGKKVLLIFHRNVGCPVCNLRFHQIESNADYFASKNTVVLNIYESSETKMKEFIEGRTFKTHLIANPDLSLYNLFALELSTAKILKGLFKGAIKKALAGKKLFTKSIQQDGNTNRIGAEFILDESGKVLVANYGEYIGDDLPLSEIKKVID